MLATFVSNPLTTPGIVVAGYCVGTLSLDMPFSPPGDGLPWGERIAAMGEPLLAGLFIMASTAVLLTYAGVLLPWWISAFLRHRAARRGRDHAALRAGFRPHPLGERRGRGAARQVPVDDILQGKAP